MDQQVPQHRGLPAPILEWRLGPGRGSDRAGKGGQHRVRFPFMDGFEAEFHSARY